MEMTESNKLPPLFVFWVDQVNISKASALASCLTGLLNLHDLYF